MLDLTKDVKYVKGVGPNRVKLLNKIGIYNLGDLITYYPRDYEDRSKPRMIQNLVDGEDSLIKAVAVSRVVEIRLKNRMCMYKLVVQDETAKCTIIWFNQSYLKNKFIIGETYYFFGKANIRMGKFEMSSPAFDDVNTKNNTGRIIPIYSSTYSLSQNTIRKIIENGLEMVDGNLEENMPEYILDNYNLLGINEATKKVHFPESFEEFKEARKRLVFEELLTMQVALLGLKNKYSRDIKGIEFAKEYKFSDIINDLPFNLTNAQIRVLQEIENDMEKDKSMNRLLQGDVGSGKTIVSIIAAYKAVKSGYQAAIMAPTSILASQHLESFTEILEKYNIRCELLIRKKKRFWKN